jgi:hypothetical protein
MRQVTRGIAAAVILAAAGVTLYGSSHREAPGITGSPKLDGTDFYMFRSYEAGRDGYVTFLANYIPLQDVYGGPNFFNMDPQAVYEIHVDNNGDAREDLTFQFQFRTISKNISVPVGDKMVPIPLINAGGIGPATTDTSALNVEESYTVSLIRGSRRHGFREALTNVASGSPVFKKPVDRIGDKSIKGGDGNVYAQYADNHIFDVAIPGCSGNGRVFVGQRREGFVVNLAEAFDLVNFNPLGPENGEKNVLADKNVTTLALEVPISCLANGDPVIGAWTTASTGRALGPGTGPCPSGQPFARRPSPSFVPTRDCRGWVPPSHPFARGGFTGDFTQVSRLGHPLVNELVIGLKDKDAFNASEPKNDGQFASYVPHPTLPVLIQALFGVTPPPVPRDDLVQVFLTGVPGLNQPTSVRPAEMLRLNTNIAPVAPASQNSLGVIGGDLAGYPNGRRPGDDVVDIALRAVEGILLSGNPGSFPHLTDGAPVNATIAYAEDGTVTSDQSLRLFRDTFPYLQTPLSGSPSPTHSN